jgi:hypothetical protein
MSEDPRKDEALALGWAVLNAIRIGWEKIDRRPKLSGHPLITEAIEAGELNWRDGPDGIAFILNGREYAVRLEMEPLNAERN